MVPEFDALRAVDPNGLGLRIEAPIGTLAPDVSCIDARSEPARSIKLSTA